MKIVLSPVEARIIGCLLEKQVTTPDQYPLSLNGVVTACNQKTNREPVMSLSETCVQDALDMLTKKHLITSQSGFGNRVMKYEHRFCNSEFGHLKLSPAELALITTLLLRGAQTAGELRTRSTRLHEFTDMAEVEQTLESLATREDGPFVTRLAREPGKREIRYLPLFSGEVNQAAGAVVTDRERGERAEEKYALAEQKDGADQAISEREERLALLDHKKDPQAERLALLDHKKDPLAERLALLDHETVQLAKRLTLLEQQIAELRADSIRRNG